MYFKHVLRFFNRDTDTWPTVAIFEVILKKTLFFGGGRDTYPSAQVKTVLSFFNFLVKSGLCSNNY
jgi:hypothetical protein